ncbi:borealin-like isoform X3 [Chironomus tepperi]|uniref:borealin-like isoform X3 n=1 Tax=Chironomus tepperi TaxID=113505 RepID=UPI00391F6371
MPRTKLPKVAASKRARENTSELDDILRDFDVEFENSLQSIRSAHQKNLQDAETEIENFKTELGPYILLKTMGEIKHMKSLSDSAEKTIHDLNMTVKDTIQKPDEADVGYKTSESEFDKSSTQKGNVSIVAPLRTLKSRRRSQSASNVPLSTPGPRSMMNQMKQKTPLPSSHASRSKYRTPAQKPTHQRAASADRVDTIVPKINPMTPVSILRHPRSGEVAFSVKGSPILTSNIIERTANVNIPVANGILSVRPENMDPSHLNASLIRKIDSDTITHLHTLKNNLDMLMKAYDNRMKS